MKNLKSLTFIENLEMFLLAMPSMKFEKKKQGRFPDCLYLEHENEETYQIKGESYHLQSQPDYIMVESKTPEYLDMLNGILHYFESLGSLNELFKTGKISWYAMNEAIYEEIQGMRYGFFDDNEDIFEEFVEKILGLAPTPEEFIIFYRLVLKPQSFFLPAVYHSISTYQKTHNLEENLSQVKDYLKALFKEGWDYYDYPDNRANSGKYHPNLATHGSPTERFSLLVNSLESFSFTSSEWEDMLVTHHKHSIFPSYIDSNEYIYRVGRNISATNRKRVLFDLTGINFQLSEDIQPSVQTFLMKMEHANLIINYGFRKKTEIEDFFNLFCTGVKNIQSLMNIASIDSLSMEHEYRIYLVPEVSEHAFDTGRFEQLLNKALQFRLDLEAKKSDCALADMSQILLYHFMNSGLTPKEIRTRKQKI